MSPPQWLIKLGSQNIDLNGDARSSNYISMVADDYYYGTSLGEVQQGEVVYWPHTYPAQPPHLPPAQPSRWHNSGTYWPSVQCPLTICVHTHSHSLNLWPHSNDRWLLPETRPIHDVNIWEHRIVKVKERVITAKTPLSFQAWPLSAREWGKPH